MWYFSEEEKQLQEVCREFAKNEIAPYAEHHDTNETFNMDAFKKIEVRQSLFHQTHYS